MLAGTNVPWNPLKLEHDISLIPILSIHLLTPVIDFSRYDGLIVTSKEGARALSNYTVPWQKLDILCVGEATAQVVSTLGGYNITVARGYGDSLLEILENQDNRWLYVRPRAIASSWPKQARVMGKKIDEVILYETSCNETMEAIEIAGNGILIFTSPSSIKCFLKRYHFTPKHSIVVIGFTTQKALPQGIESVVAEKTTVESCIESAKKLAL